MTTLYMILTGPAQDSWTWRATDDCGNQIAVAEHAFNCYLEMLDDARQHGFSQKPEYLD